MVFDAVNLVFLLYHTIFSIPSLLSLTPTVTLLSPSCPLLPLLCSLVTVAWVSLRTTVLSVPSSAVTAWPSCPFPETCRPAAPTCCSRPPASSTSLTQPVREHADCFLYRHTVEVYSCAAVFVCSK